MVGRKPGRKVNRTASGPGESATADLTKIANLLALLLVRRQEPRHKVATLMAAGFIPQEVARLLGVTPNAVAAARYRRKKAGTAKPKAARRR